MMNDQEDFFINGFTVLRDCVSADWINRCRESIAESLSAILGKPCDFVDYHENLLEAKERYRLADVHQKIHGDMQGKGLKTEFLLHPCILDTLIRFLGPDLAYARAGQIFINLESERNPVYKKRWHQEVWSGGGTLQLHLWIPIIIPESLGGIEFIKQSHHWGLIPNQNREPTKLPDAYEIICPELKEGDFVIFSSFALHRTVVDYAAKKPRVALAVSIRNIYHPFSGHEHHLSWQNFHLSPVAKVEKILGNPYLSPFRTLGGEIGLTTDNKPNLPGILE